MTPHFSQYQTFWQLILRNFYLFKPRIKNQMLNGVIWASINVFVFSFLMPQANPIYGAFILITNAIAQGFILPMHNIIVMISDIENGESNLKYELTLPLSPSLVFVRYIISNAYQALITTLPILPVGVLMLGSNFSFAHFSFFKFYFILMLTCFFASCFALFLASHIYDLLNISNIWIRIIFPMWFLGGFQFPWSSLYKLSPCAGYLGLLNPMTYALEGGRAAALDPALSLPYGICIAALIIFSIFFGYLGVTKLKKRLDCL